MNANSGKNQNSTVSFHVGTDLFHACKCNLKLFDGLCGQHLYGEWDMPCLKLLLLRCGVCNVRGHEDELHERFGPAGGMRGFFWDLKEVYGERLTMTKEGFVIKE